MEPKPRVTFSIYNNSMWCESCGTNSISAETFYRIYPNGTEVKSEKCEECNYRQETEIVRRTVRIKEN